MFTPDNFHEVLKQQFAQSHGIMHAPLDHGTKDISRFAPYLTPQENSSFLNLQVPARMRIPRVILYDQEPIESSATDFLRQNHYDYLDNSLHYIVPQADFAELISLFWPSTSYPIWCNSDYQGQAIDVLKTRYFIPCAYWHHAFVARDWYRHYQYWSSLEPRDRDQAPHRFLMYCRDVTGSRTYRETVRQQLQHIQHQIKHDWEGKAWIPSDLSATINADDAQSSTIHLVLETLFDTDKLYLTEKVFKPMVMNQAFIIWGPPGTLAFLKARGFQTFGDIWSESYDDQKDPDQRMASLTTLIKQLSQLDTNSWRNVYKKCLPIIEHNRAWFYSEKFMSNCWQELKQNFQSAGELRQQWEQTQPGGQFFRIVSQNPEFYKIARIGAAIRKYLEYLPPGQVDSLRKCYPNLNV